MKCADTFLYLYIFSFINPQEYTPCMINFAKTCRSFHKFVCQQSYVWRDRCFSFGPTKNVVVAKSLFSLRQSLQQFVTVSMSEEVKGFRIQNVDLTELELDQGMLSFFHSLSSIEISNTRVKWRQLSSILDFSCKLKVLLIDKVTVEGIDPNGFIRLPHLAHLEITDMRDNLFSKISCPAVQSMKLIGAEKSPSERTVQLFPRIAPRYIRLENINLSGCHPALTFSILTSANSNCLRRVELANTQFNLEFPVSSVHLLTLGSFEDSSMKQVIEKVKQVFPNVKELVLYDTFLENMSSNREDSKAYGIENLTNVPAIPNNPKLAVQKIMVLSAKIPLYMRRCLERELSQLVSWDEIEYSGPGSGLRATCADQLIVEILDREIFTKQSLVLETEAIQQAYILCTGYCRSQNGNTRNRLHQFWNYMLQHSFDPAKVREFGLSTLLEKSKHIRELHGVMTNCNTSEESVKKFESLFDQLRESVHYKLYLNPDPCFPVLIKQLENCANSLKHDIERVNIGNLDVLLNRQRWVSDQIVEEYNGYQSMSIEEDEEMQ